MSTRRNDAPSRNFLRREGLKLKLRLAAAVAGLSLGGALGGAASASTPGDELASADGQYLNWLDRDVAPRTDFFRFANGGWLKSHPIPPDRSGWGVDTILEQENQNLIRSLVESLGKGDWPEGSAERKVADFYLSGMDEGAIEARSRTCKRSASKRRCKSARCRTSRTAPRS
jgi:putative endopeptidase